MLPERSLAVFDRSALVMYGEDEIGVPCAAQILCRIGGFPVVPLLVVVLLKERIFGLIRFARRLFPSINPDKREKESSGREREIERERCV